MKHYGIFIRNIQIKYAAEQPFCELCIECGLAVPMEAYLLERFKLEV